MAPKSELMARITKPSDQNTPSHVAVHRLARFPFDDTQGVAFLTDFHTNPSHKKGLGALKTIHVHPRFFCHSGAFGGPRCSGVARGSGA